MPETIHARCRLPHKAYFGGLAWTKNRFVERNRFAEEEMSFFAGRVFHVGAVFAWRKG